MTNRELPQGMLLPREHLPVTRLPGLWPIPSSVRMVLFGLSDVPPTNEIKSRDSCRG